MRAELRQTPSDRFLNHEDFLRLNVVPKISLLPRSDPARIAQGRAAGDGSCVEVWIGLLIEEVEDST